MAGLWKSFSSLACQSIFGISTSLTTSIMPKRFLPTLLRMHQRNMEFMENPPHKKKRTPLSGKPQAKGLILKTVIKKPRKPNSANRKCVLVRLSTKKEVISFVPGIGHNLQEHQTVLVSPHKLKDTPGVKFRCIRGKYDLPLLKSKK